jgi:hypothetical protein
MQITATGSGHSIPVLTLVLDIIIAWFSNADITVIAGSRRSLRD